MSMFALSLFVFGPAAARPPAPPVPIFPEEVVLEPAPGSLYVEHASREVTGVDLNTWRRGDIVRVIVVESTNTDLESITQTGVTSTTEADISALMGANIPQLGIGVDVSPTLGVGGGRTREFEGDGRVTSGARVQTSVACQVIEVMPGGNLRIWGYKETRVNRETQYVTLEGIIRPKDITPDGAVESDQVAQALVEIVGRGVIADTQGPGLGTRIVDRVWPF